MIDGIHLERVTAWMQETIPGLATPLKFQLLTGGHSNLTFKCTTTNGDCYVLRRPPLGHVLESAHDMGREYKIINALQQADVPVAKTWGLCQDTAINDAPFYVMGFVDGTVLHDSELGTQVEEGDRRALGFEVIDTLARLHLINPDDVGLGQLGRKEAYLTRQLKRWNGQWQATKTHEIPAMEESSRLLAEKMPEQIGATIVHGDYRLGNMIVEGRKLSAILDWELCTLGDPLADVGYLLNNWVSAGEIETRAGDQAPTAVGGYPSRDELCARYSEATGRDLSAINYYRAFSHWRLAAIGQGVYKRYLVGAMGKDHGVDLERQKQGVITRAEAALALLS